MLSEELVGIDGERFHQKGIDKPDQEDGKDRTDINPSHTVGRNNSPKRPQDGLGQSIEENRHRVEGGDPDPGKNGPENNNPDIDHQDNVDNTGDGD